MEITYYPYAAAVECAKKADDPLLLLIAFDESDAPASNIDHALEHHILLKKTGRSESAIDRYFRVVLNRNGADWTFACPADYKGIKDRDRGIERFYNDGVDAIRHAAKQLGYDVHVNIPARYRRHFDALSNNH